MSAKSSKKRSSIDKKEGKHVNDVEDADATTTEKRVKRKYRKKEKKIPQNDPTAPAEPPKPKKPLGRPRKRPYMTKEQEKVARQEKRKEEREAILKEQAAPTVILKNAQITEVITLSPLPHMPVTTSSNNSDGNQWLFLSDAEKQQQRNNIHISLHRYIVQTREDENDPYSEFKFYHIGPCSLPFMSKNFVFNIEVEKRPSDYGITPLNWRRVDRALKEEPRYVCKDSFQLSPATFSANNWPPTASQLVDMMKVDFRESYTLMQAHLCGGKYLSMKLDSLVVSDLTYERNRNALLRSIQNISLDTKVNSIEKLDALLFLFAREKYGPLVTSDWKKNPEHVPFHILQEQCYWIYREYFLGAIYFELCEFFPAIELVNQTRERLELIIPQMVNGGLESSSPNKIHPERICTFILNKFLRPDVVGGKFRNGEALIRFINKYVSNPEVLRLILPSFADHTTFGCPPPALHHPKSLDQDFVNNPPPVSGLTIPSTMYTKVPPDCIVRDSSSIEAVSIWYDSLRRVYYRLVVDPFTRLGDLFYPATIQREEVEYADFLVKRDFMIVLPHVNDIEGTATFIKRHIDITVHEKSVLKDAQSSAPSTPYSTSTSVHTPRDDIGGEESSSSSSHSSSMAFIYVDPNNPNGEEGEESVFGNKGITGDSVGLMIVSSSYNNSMTPSSLGANAPIMVYPKMAAALSQNVIEIVIKNWLIERYETSVLQHVTAIATAACNTLCLEILDEPREKCTLEEIEYLSNVQKAFEIESGYGENAELVKDALKEVLLKRKPVYFIEDKTARKNISWLKFTQNGFEYLNHCLMLMHQSPYLQGAAFVNKVDQWKEVHRIQDNDKLYKLALELLRYPVVVVDYPFSYAEKTRKSTKSLDQDLLTVANYLADYTLSPGDTEILDLLTYDSRIFTRPSTGNRFVCIKELEKWTIQQFKEALNTCFSDFRATSDFAKGSCVLWIFADTHALDFGCVSILDQLSQSIPHIKKISLRDMLVVRSNISCLATKIRLTERIENREQVDLAGTINREYFVYSKADEMSMTKIFDDGDDIIKEEYIQLEPIEVKDIALYRVARTRPNYAKVLLSTIDDWRQLYTLTCYVKECLVLIGTESMLRRIYSSSVDDFYIIPNDASSTNKRLYADQTVVLDDSTTGRLEFIPRRSLDVWSSIRTRHDESSNLPDGVHIQVGKRMEGDL